jgi:hypothetical protein
MTSSDSYVDSVEKHAAAESADIYVRLLVQNQKVADFNIVDNPELLAQKIALLRMTLIKEFMKQPRNLRPQ